jgi:hypothetical protein
MTHPMETMMTEGYTVWKNQIDQKILYDLAYNKFEFDHPDRGHDVNGKYYAGYQDGVEWANYWTGPLNDNPRIADIRKVVDRLVGRFLVIPVFYHADISVLTPKNSLIRPHVDTPHRHAPWNEKIKKILGVQVAIPLHSVAPTTGTTAFLPGSHRKVWPIKDCYAGKFTQEFIYNCVQPEVNFGDVLMWDARTLHSQMPNISTSNRYMLLLNYLEEYIVEDVMNYEVTQFAESAERSSASHASA